MNKKEKKLVVKSNELNSYTFYKSSVELKVFSRVILEIRENPSNNKYRIPTKELMSSINFKDKGYSQLKDIVQDMFGTIKRDKKNGVGFSVIFTDIDVDYSGYIDFEINKNIIPHLVELSNSFTSYYFENISRLKSYYSIRLYELLKQFQNKDLHGWWFITIEELRDILKIEQTQYSRYNDFKRKVIILAQKELEEKTDIKFDFEEHKIGRKIEKIKFIIQPNNKNIIESETVEQEEVLQAPKPNFKNYEEYSLLSEKLKLSDSLIEKLYIDFDRQRIINNANYTANYLDNGHIKNSTTQFIQTAIKKDYAQGENLFNSEILNQEQEKINAENKKKEQERILKDQRNRYILEELEKTYIDYQKQEVEKYIFEDLERSLEFYKQVRETKNSKITPLEEIDDILEFQEFILGQKGKFSGLVTYRTEFRKAFDRKYLNFIEYAKTKGYKVEQLGEKNYKIIDF
jgi:plasmid replication initiation protein